ncbi:MAG: hypothetical protein ACYC2G_13540, partial [Gemmatimonadaceae bacterium]
CCIAKTKTKAVVRNGHAAVRTADSLPVFYFVFEQTNPGVNNNVAFFSATSPNEFTLIRLDVKGNSRETVVASQNVMSVESGTEDRANVPFTFTKLRAGVYLVSPSDPLTAGEYAFLSSAGWGSAAAGTAGANRLFDFSVTAAP